MEKLISFLKWKYSEAAFVGFLILMLFLSTADLISYKVNGIFVIISIAYLWLRYKFVHNVKS